MTKTTPPTPLAPADEVYEISDKAFVDGIELLHLIAVMEAQNENGINQKLSAAGAAGAAMVVRNGLLSRIVLFLAGAYAQSRPGDLHLRRAFDLLQQPGVLAELKSRGSPTHLANALQLWTQRRGDHRFAQIKMFRDKFTAHLGKPPPNMPNPPYKDVFGFAADTMKVIDALALGTGARREALDTWQSQAADTAKKFWHVWR